MSTTPSPTETTPDSAKAPLIRQTLAWGVHLFTAIGAVMGLMAMINIVNERWLAAFVYMAISIGIDSVDGSLARLVKVKKVLPNFDGSLLDNIVDYFTYVIVPAFFIYEAHIMPAGFALLSAIGITLASGYQFCQADAKTEDHYFKGFPSYWNVVVFYLFVLEWSPWVNFAIVTALTVGVFVPVKYLYPSRTQVLPRLNLALTGVWAVLMLAVLVRFDHDYRVPLYLSLVYVAYYGVMSVYLTFKTRGA